ncbi:MAG: hypothetical protein QG629_792 [Patescibacteria group bacterium]|nr:hypothetical protein [Candidatus Saccharibacteria bacterium]MDQ5963709.1 hypothetical protein [Patescibacteria group bacterium]
MLQATVFADATFDPERKPAIDFGLELVGAQLTTMGGIAVRHYNIGGSLPMLNSRQVDGPRVLGALPAWRNKALEVFVTGKDLGHPQVNFIYGMSQFGEGKAIFSHSRYTEEEDVALAALVAHEVGHSLGLVNPAKPNYDRRNRFAGHCANVCLMQAVNNKAEALQAAQTIVTMPKTSGFCGDCTSHLQAFKTI